MKHKLSFIIVYWWLLLLLAAGAGMLFFAPREAVASETENRMLQGFPKPTVQSLKDGSFMSAFDAFLSDRMFGRDAVISATNGMLDVFSALRADDLASVNMEDALFEEVETFAGEPVEEDTEAAALESAPADAAQTDTPAATPSPDAGGEADAADTAGDASAASGNADQFGMWFLRADGRREVIYSFKPYDLKKIALMLNAYSELLPEDGRVVFAHPPSANLVNRWVSGGFTGMTSNAEDEIARLSNERVSVLNVLDVLRPHIEAGEYLFFRTDHHWTPRAACYMHEAFLALMSVPALSYDDYSYTKIDGYLGSVYEGMPTQEYRDMADTIEAMEPLTPARLFTVRYLEDQSENPLVDTSRSDYKVFIGTAKGPAWRVDTGAHTGRKLLVISDSFGNALVPYFTPYYDEVHLINLRKDMFTPLREGATTREYITHYGIDDIFITPSTFTGIHSSNLEDYLMEYIDERKR